MFDYEVVIFEGSGFDGANWLLGVSHPKQIPGSWADRNRFEGSGFHIITKFEDRGDAEAARDEMLRSFILQASSMTPSTERR